MLNLNLNIIECQRRKIAPVLANTFFYNIIGGGGGGSAGGGAIGGKGGQGGRITTGSFSVNHLSTFNIYVGSGGSGGTPIGGLGANGVSSSLVYESSTVATGNGGLGNYAAPTGSRGEVSFPVPYINPSYSSLLFSQDGTAGGDSPVGLPGQGGGTNNTTAPPWSTSPTPSSINALVNLAGGGGGERWDQFPGGNGASGIGIVSFYDPNDFYDYTGNWAYFFYEGGYKYFWYTSDGSFTLFGKKSST